MFVHAFDGPWSKHPFWLPRFRLTAQDDVDRILNSDLETLVIDEARGVPLSDSGAPGEGAIPPPAPAPALRLAAASSIVVDGRNSFAQERGQATKLVKQSTRAMRRLFEDVHAGNGLPLEQFAPIVHEVIGSVSRNPQALVALTRLRDADEYTFVHSLAVSALMTRFARALGMSDAEIFDLSLAGLLHDIGKMIVPDSILKKPSSLTEEEFALVRTHPEQGYTILSQNAAMPPIVLDVCRHHHERVGGGGYPFKLKGDAISRYARIAAICDVYDALTSNRSYKEAWSAQEAITRMAEWEGHFDRPLLFAFMKTMGIFPPGLLVQLRSNRLGITLPNGRRASRPLVRAFFCTRELVAIPLEDVVIEDDLAHDQIISEQYALDWGITAWPLVAEDLLAGVAPANLPGGRSKGDAARAA